MKKNAAKSFMAIFCFIVTLNGNASEKTPNPADYPAKVVSQKTDVIDRSDPFTREYRTRFTDALKNPITFAGEFAVTRWGCGSSGCTVTAFINVRTGKALAQTFSSYYDANEEAVGEEIHYSDKGSRLLVTYETGEQQENGERKHYYNYYLLDSENLKLITKRSAP